MIKLNMLPESERIDVNESRSLMGGYGDGCVMGLIKIFAAMLIVIIVAGTIRFFMYVNERNLTIRYETMVELTGADIPFDSWKAMSSEEKAALLLRNKDE